MRKALILLWMNGVLGIAKRAPGKARCLAYRAYDLSKSSFPIRWLIFGGGKYQHFGGLAIEGTVVSISGGSLDGDWTFNVQLSDGKQFHCEITPCFPIDVSNLALGDRVRVSGVSTFDPTHFDIPGHWEIHPVRSLDIVKGAV